MIKTTPLRFGITFVVGFALMMGAFEVSRGTAFERFVVEDLILVPTTILIEAITPREHVTLVGRTIVRPAVTRGCEGIEMFLLLIGAILAFPASIGLMALYFLHWSSASQRRRGRLCIAVSTDQGQASVDWSSARYAADGAPLVIPKGY